MYYKLTIFIKKIFSFGFLKNIGVHRHDFVKYLASRRMPPYHVKKDEIMLDVTYACELRCVKCNRSCGYAPTDDEMRLEQIEKFIDESIKTNRKWKKIMLEGGEPTSHSDIEQIIDMINDYIKEYSPSTLLQLNTNGYSEETKQFLESVKHKVKIYNTNKTSKHNDCFISFNKAPIDFKEYNNVDCSMACFNTSLYGIALNMNGYYYCTVAAGIDRVLGLDIGRKQLPAEDDEMKDQMQNFCKYCGFFIERTGKDHLGIEITSKIDVTQSWKEIYKKYNEQPPKLNRY